MQISISKLDPKDWRDYKTILLEALKEDPQAFGSKYSEWVNYSDDKWQERPNNPDTILCIARDENKPVGIVGIHIEKQNDKKVAHIWGMFVSLSYRGKGLGKLLIQKLLEEVEKLNNVDVVELMVNSNQKAAVKLYSNMGFNKTGEKEWILGDGKNHVLDVMKLSLR